MRLFGRPSVTLDDIKSFRQLDSACPGHPEYHLTSGVEATTGPLGQGVAMSVGLAMAERWLGEYFNRLDFSLVDWRTYAMCGDGCMMEGISGEAASLAGHLGLHKLCWIYDFKPGNDRREHPDRLHGGRCDAVSRLRLESAARARCQ